MISDRAGRSDLRRHAYRLLSDLRTASEQTLAEPPPASTVAAAWWPAVVALERVLDATTALDTGLRHGTPQPSEQEAKLVRSAFTELSASARERRAPRRLTVPEQPELSDLADELTVTRGAFENAHRQQGVIAARSATKARRTRGLIGRLWG